MKNVLSVQPGYKIALVLLVMIAMLLSGILLERHFFRQVDTASTALYEDRLMPATFVYQLADYIHQRHRLAEAVYLKQQPVPTALQADQMEAYRLKMDSVVVAFRHTYLVQDESASLKRLVAGLGAYAKAERQMLADPVRPENLDRLEQHLDAIRAELLQLSSIQTTVGKELLIDTENVVANAYALNQLQIVLLIVCCFVAQLLILSIKAVRSPIRQQPNLN
ncbi:MAG: hypothetical protein EP344_12370 [Bacteroidetes bacterium]|nr:MAG: hypothetical protein EP344_12370 [Bacteroidota bacterium]